MVFSPLFFQLFENGLKRLKKSGVLKSCTLKRFGFKLPSKRGTNVFSLVFLLHFYYFRRMSNKINKMGRQSLMKRSS